MGVTAGETAFRDSSSVVEQGARSPGEYGDSDPPYRDSTNRSLDDFCAQVRLLPVPFVYQQPQGVSDETAPTASCR